MEKGLNWYVLETFQIPSKDIRTYSPQTLAYIGDGVYDLIIRSIMVGQGNTSAGQLHRKTSKLVNAKAQAEMIELLLPELSETEEVVYRRGRNAKSPTMAKHASMSEYRRATGFEALMGYLYLEGNMDRILELVKLGLSRFKPEGEKQEEGRTKEKFKGQQRKQPADQGKRDSSHLEDREEENREK